MDTVDTFHTFLFELTGECRFQLWTPFLQFTKIGMILSSFFEPSSMTHHKSGSNLVQLG